MVVANCARCKRVFQKTHTAMCPECHNEFMLNVSHVYRYVQDNPSKTLEEIAHHCKVPLSELSNMFFNGTLGTAAEHVLYNCLRCGVPMAPVHRYGRFCLHCAEKVESEARLNPKPEVEDKTQAQGRNTVRKKPGFTPTEAIPETPSNTEPPRTENLPERTSEVYGFKRAT